MIIFVLVNSSYASGFATSIGTEDFKVDEKDAPLTTTSIINTSKNYYLGLGYSPSNKLVDPSSLLLLSNLMAEVQLFSTNDQANSYWSTNTKLVTYIACNTGGENGIADNNSLVHQTVAVGSVDVCVGFKKIISFSQGGEEWARNYNMYLASGYGVEDAMNYANSINYGNNNVHSTYLVYNSATTTPNMKIGKYANTFSDIDSIEKDYLEEKIDGFNRENYVVSKETSEIYDINTNNVEKTEHIDVRFKINDFYTNAGYNIKVKNNRIEAIYDNNIDIDKQKNALMKKEEFLVDNIEEVLNKKREVNNDIKYFYDIENDKKYLEILVKEEISDSFGGTDIAVDTLRYEI